MSTDHGCFHTSCLTGNDGVLKDLSKVRHYLTCTRTIFRVLLPALFKYLPELISGRIFLDLWLIDSLRLSALNDSLCVMLPFGITAVRRFVCDNLFACYHYHSSSQPSINIPLTSKFVINLSNACILPASCVSIAPDALQTMPCRSLDTFGPSNTVSGVAFDSSSLDTVSSILP